MNVAQNAERRRQAELDALERFGDACVEIETAAHDGDRCDHIAAALEVLRAIEIAVYEAQAALRAKELLRSL